MGVRQLGTDTATSNSFRTELGFLLENRTDAGATQTARVNGWVNDAYLYMAHPSVHKFRETQAIYTITLATGDYDYAIDSTTVGYHIVAVRWVTHVMAAAFTPTARKRKLDPRGARWFEERTLSTGQPTIYTVDGEFILVANVPRLNENNQLLRVGVYREPAILSVDTATTILPSYFDRPLLKFAQGFAEADLGDRDLSIVTLREAQQLLNNAAEETELEAEDTGWQVEFEITSPMEFTT